MGDNPDGKMLSPRPLFLFINDTARITYTPLSVSTALARTPYQHCHATLLDFTVLMEAYLLKMRLLARRSL